MKAVSAVLISLAASAMAMPPPQRLERRQDVTDGEGSGPWNDDCFKVFRTALEDCEKSAGDEIDCSKESRKAGMTCMIDTARPKSATEAQHKECSEAAVQGVEDCMGAKNNAKTMPQCQRAQLDTYLGCANRPISLETEFVSTWNSTCSEKYHKAHDECQKIQDFGNKCEHELIDNDMQCMLDNAKARPESDYVHAVCSAAAIANMNDCYYRGNEGKLLQQCRREQWDAYPECVKKYPPQSTTATEAAKDGDALQNATATEPAKAGCESAL